jgi:ankyrin repeat protein
MIKMKAVAVAGVFAASMAFFGSAQVPAIAHETDQYALPAGREFADIGDYLTTYFYDALDRAVVRANARIHALGRSPKPADLAALQTPEALSDAVYAELPDAYTFIETIEKVLNSDEMKRRYPGKIVGDKTLFSNNYYLIPIDPRAFFRLWSASTLYAFGHYFGGDKIGHFSDMGKRYFDEYRAGVRAGEPEEKAVRRAIDLGTKNWFLSEAGLLGEVSAGDYSNGDLAANYAGFAFYRNLTEPVPLKGSMRPPMVERDGNYFKLAAHVGPDSNFLSYFFSDHLDEALNPGVFEALMRIAVRREINGNANSLLWRYRDPNGSLRPASYFVGRCRELATYYGSNYGHAGSLDELVTIDQSCYPAAAPDAALDSRNGLGMTPLHIAIYRANAAAVAKLLGRGADPNAPIHSATFHTTTEGDTPLHIAAASGQVGIAKLLFDRNAKIDAVNTGGATPLHCAASSADVTAMLLDRHARIDVTDSAGRTPLHWASAFPAGATAVFLERGAKPDLRDNLGQTPLHRAARLNNVAVAKLLLAAKADPNAADSTGASPVHLAAMLPDAEMLTLLLKSGGNPKLTDDFGYTPLHAAARGGSVDCVDQLIRAGAALDSRDAAGSTPLHLACRHRRPMCASRLISAGSDVGAVNAAGSTPLHEAAITGDRRLADLLISRGANAALPDRRGRTPLQLAANNASLVSIVPRNPQTSFVGNNR